MNYYCLYTCSPTLTCNLFYCSTHLPPVLLCFACRRPREARALVTVLTPVIAAAVLTRVRLKTVRCSVPQLPAPLTFQQLWMLLKAVPGRVAHRPTVGAPHVVIQLAEAL